MLLLKAVPVVLAKRIEAGVLVVPQLVMPWQVELQLARFEVHMLFPLVLQMNPPGLAMVLPALRVSNPPFWTKLMIAPFAGAEKTRRTHSKSKGKGNVILERSKEGLFGIYIRGGHIAKVPSRANKGK